VEGADPQRPRGYLQQPASAFTHLAGRLVGKGDRQDAEWRDMIDLDEPGQPVDQYAGLAATGTGQHQDVFITGADR
jgi:hypothetical protein